MPSRRRGKGNVWALRRGFLDDSDEEGDCVDAVDLTLSQIQARDSVLRWSVHHGLAGDKMYTASGFRSFSGGLASCNVPATTLLCKAPAKPRLAQTTCACIVRTSICILGACAIQPIIT